MQDRFRFRAWEISKKKYHYDVQDWYEFFVIDYPDKYITEQCTGLKDKNGKLIYEGDVVEFYSMSFLDALSGRQLKRKVGRVVWNNEYLKVDVIVGNETIPDLCVKTDDGHFVIIGNIHENPELLEGVK